jgi:hypothetical protein
MPAGDMEMFRDNQVLVCLVAQLEHEQALLADDGHACKSDSTLPGSFGAPKIACNVESFCYVPHDVRFNVPHEHRGGEGADILELFVILCEFAARDCPTRGTFRDSRLECLQLSRQRQDSTSRLSV